MDWKATEAGTEHGQTDVSPNRKLTNSKTETVARRKTDFSKRKEKINQQKPPCHNLEGILWLNFPHWYSNIVCLHWN